MFKYFVANISACNNNSNKIHQCHWNIYADVKLMHTIQWIGYVVRQLHYMHLQSNLLWLNSFRGLIRRAVEKINRDLHISMQVNIKWFLFCSNDYCWFNCVYAMSQRSNTTPFHNTHVYCEKYTYIITQMLRAWLLWKQQLCHKFTFSTRELNKPEKHWWQKNCIHPQIV